MRVVAIQRYIEPYDDTEFAFFVLNNGDVVVHVTYLCGNRPSYNQKIAVKCTNEKFEKILEMKVGRQVIKLFDREVATEEELDALVNSAYDDLREEKGLEVGWFNGHTL